MTSHLLPMAISLSLAACGSSSATPDTGVPADAGMPDTDTGAPPDPDSGMGTDAGGPTAEEVRAWVDAYAAAHPGSEGDINVLTPSQIAADSDAQRLLGVCGDDQRPVYPRLAWEHGGADHAWINPDASALCYCVYTPVSPGTDHWSYDPPPTDHVTADIYILFPEENPCRDDVGADRVINCIGDPSNFEILVDTASLHDGLDVGLNLAEASTELRLILSDGSRVHLHDAL